LIFYKPHPLYPLPLIEGEGEFYLLRGASAPLKHPNTKFLRGAKLLFLISFPLMLRIHLHIMERGIKGVRLISNSAIIKFEYIE